MMSLKYFFSNYISCLGQICLRAKITEPPHPPTHTPNMVGKLVLMTNHVLLLAAEIDLTKNNFINAFSTQRVLSRKWKDLYKF